MEPRERTADPRPKCKVCEEVGDGEPAEATFLALVTVNLGGSKRQKFMTTCDNHYPGGTGFLLTPIPSTLLKPKTA